MQRLRALMLELVEKKAAAAAVLAASLEMRSEGGAAVAK
jgi:hypothetical protein